MPCFPTKSLDEETGNTYVSAEDEKEQEAEEDRPKNTTSVCCESSLCLRIRSYLPARRAKAGLMVFSAVLGVILGVSLKDAPMPTVEGMFFGPRIMFYMTVPVEIIWSLKSLITIPMTITSLVSTLFGYSTLIISCFNNNNMFIVQYPMNFSEPTRNISNPCSAPL